MNPLAAALPFSARSPTAVAASGGEERQRQRGGDKKGTTTATAKKKKTAAAWGRNDDASGESAAGGGGRDKALITTALRTLEKDMAILDNLASLQPQLSGTEVGLLLGAIAASGVGPIFFPGTSVTEVLAPAAAACEFCFTPPPPCFRLTNPTRPTAYVFFFPPVRLSTPHLFRLCSFFFLSVVSLGDDLPTLGPSFLFFRLPFFHGSFG
jgi:hypothetical protein